MTAITVQIGNSDDKLSQVEWSDFVSHVESAINQLATEVHFSGVSHGSAKWQNAAWVFTCSEKKVVQLRDWLRDFCEAFHQDSIAWTEGQTEFIAAANGGSRTTRPMRHMINWTIKPGQNRNDVSLDARKEPEGKYTIPLVTLEFLSPHKFDQYIESVRYFAPVSTAAKEINQ